MSLTPCCSCSKKSKCFKCVCNFTSAGCTNCKSPLCHFSNVRKADDEPGTTSTEKAAKVSNEVTDGDHRKVMIESMNIEQLREVLSAMTVRDPTGFDAIVFPPTSDHDVPSWCICKKCTTLEKPKMNSCCKKAVCITLDKKFIEMCLNASVVEACGILNYCETFHDEPTFQSSHHRNQAYRFFILWQYGKLGRGNRICPPACVVSSIRSQYPSGDGTYVGYDDALGENE